MPLSTYKSKRNFKHTAEPKGKKSRSKSGCSFVIQKHAASHLHYDFRLELNGVLLSWAVPKGPSVDPEVKRLAVHVEDHPLDYGSFEGTIPKGQYGAGTVEIWDKGTWEPDDANPNAAYKKGHLSFTLKGRKCKGRWALTRINNNDKTWLLIKKSDTYAKTRQELAFKEGKSAVFPKKLKPELCTLVAELPANNNEWLYEIKFDGYRLLVLKQNNKVNIYTRNGHNWTSKFGSIVREAKYLPDNIAIDGEVVVLDDKQHSNFQMLQNSIKNQDDQSFIYYAFDIIYLDKYNLSSLPLIKRKEVLKEKLAALPNKVIRYSDHVIGSGKKLLAQACKMGLEGLVAKKVDSTYMQKRSKDWLKIKCSQRQEFIIVGYTPPQGSRQGFGSLVLGTYNNKKELVCNGNVGTGFNDALLKSLYAKLQKIKTDKMPFNSKPIGLSKAIWVKPLLVAEVEFTEWTTDNRLRHPSFKGLRLDKKPQSIHKEKPWRKSKRA